MRLQTPSRFQNLAYFGFDTRATNGIGDELIGFGIGRLYVGIYPTATGFEVAYGVTNEHGCL